MRKLLYALIAAVAWLVSGCQMSPFTPDASATGQPPAHATQLAAAKEGLATLAHLVNEKNYAALGFESPDEVRQATLGEPLQSYRVRLDALRALPESIDAEKLLEDARRSLYPVEVKQRVASSIVVTQSRDGWRATDFGNAGVARAITRYRKGPTDFIVHVPALKVYFVAKRTEGTLTLTPIMDDPRADFKAGEPVPAAVALKRLQKMALEYNGLPN